METITVVGCGLAGLIAATEVAEAGAPVRVLEARSRLGGRATSTPAPYVANHGPHAVYASTALWSWLQRRRLHQPSRIEWQRPVRFRWEGRIRSLPPSVLLRIVKLRRADAPVDADLRSWLTDRFDERTARAIVGACGALCFDHDPGRLSAAFVVERIQRILLSARPNVRYMVGGWATLVQRLVDHARSTGVEIETGARVEPGELADLGPTIVAVEPGAARRLLGDPALRPESPRTALLDLGLEHGRRDPVLVFDLDEAAFIVRVTATDRTAAPADHELVQAMVGLRPGEELAGGVTRIETVLDQSFIGWRDRETWRRRAVVHESSGAVDLPGTTWRDRTPVTYADGVWLAGDWVASRGHLSEVSCTSAIAAARHAVAAAIGLRRRATTAR